MLWPIFCFVAREQKVLGKQRFTDVLGAELGASAPPTQHQWPTREILAHNPQLWIQPVAACKDLQGRIPTRVWEENLPKPHTWEQDRLFFLTSLARAQPQRCILWSEMDHCRSAVKGFVCPARCWWRMKKTDTPAVGFFPSAPRVSSQLESHCGKKWTLLHHAGQPDCPGVSHIPSTNRSLLLSFTLPVRLALSCGFILHRERERDVFPSGGPCPRLRSQKRCRLPSKPLAVLWWILIFSAVLQPRVWRYHGRKACLGPSMR